MAALLRMLSGAIISIYIVILINYRQICVARTLMERGIVGNTTFGVSWHR